MGHATLTPGGGRIYSWVLTFLSSEVGFKDKDTMKNDNDREIQSKKGSLKKLGMPFFNEF